MRERAINSIPQELVFDQRTVSEHNKGLKATHDLLSVWESHPIASVIAWKTSNASRALRAKPSHDLRGWFDWHVRVAAIARQPNPAWLESLISDIVTCSAARPAFDYEWFILDTATGSAATADGSSQMNRAPADGCVSRTGWKNDTVEPLYNTVHYRRY